MAPDPSHPRGVPIDATYVERSLQEVKTAVARGGAEGCKHALQVLCALHAYLTPRLSSRDPCARLYVRQVLEHARVSLGDEVQLQAREDHQRRVPLEGHAHEEGGQVSDHAMLLGVLHDIERMTLSASAVECAGSEAEDVSMGDEGCVPCHMDVGWDTVQPEDASTATRVCEACGDIVLERRMEQHVAHWCRRGPRY